MPFILRKLDLDTAQGRVDEVIDLCSVRPVYGDVLSVLWILFSRMYSAQAEPILQRV